MAKAALLLLSLLPFSSLALNQDFCCSASPTSPSGCVSSEVLSARSPIHRAGRVAGQEAQGTVFGGSG
ncbi:hypothetical protein SEVIR_6G180302v4 [Setaria viridis]